MKRFVDIATALLLLVTFIPFVAFLLHIDLIVPLIKSFYLLQRRIKRNCL